MTTPIGQSLAKSPYRLTAAACVGIFTVVCDLIFVSQNWWCERGIVPLIAVVMLVQLNYGDCTSLGMRASPLQGWAYWFRATLWLGLAIAVVLMAWVWILIIGGYELPVVTTPPSSAAYRFWHLCIYAPVLEESIYRFILCVPLAALLRPWAAIAVSGFVFGLLHFVYGNPSPENAIGGFILAWCFLKSGSIYVPVLLHSLGNSVVLAGQVGGWHLIQSNG